MKTLITVDVEAHRGKTPIDSFIWGSIANGKKYGLELIVDSLIRQNFTGIFFVDFAEIIDYGEEPIAKVVNYLINKGQDIGLHLHPDHFGDKSRTFLWEYSYEEQYNMMSVCMSYFKKLTGEKPIIFRAGKFSANDDTITILDELKIPFDSSSYYKHRWCKISEQHRSNAPYRIATNVIEIPVSLFGSVNIGKKEYRFDQMDLGCSNIEFRSFVGSQQKTETNVILTSFFHSFSFFPHRKNPEKMRFSKYTFRSFIKNLHSLKKFGIEVLRTKDLSALYPDICCREKSEIGFPTSGNIFVQLIWLFQRSFSIIQTNFKARLFVSGFCIATFLFIFSICILVKGIIN